MGGVRGRYTVLADPSGFFAAGSVSAFLESQRPYQLVPCTSKEASQSSQEALRSCSSLLNDNRPENNERQVRIQRNERKTQGRLFVGASGGYRFQFGKFGVQLQIGGRIDPISTVRRNHSGWLTPYTLQAGLHMDGLFGE